MQNSQPSHPAANAPPGAIGGQSVRVVCESIPPDATDAFYCDIGNQLIRNRIPFMNEVLRQLLTLSVAMLGGSTFFLGPAVCHPGLRIAAMSMFLLSLLCALFGVLPFRATIRLHVVHEIRETIESIILSKDRFVWASSIFLVLGFAASVFGVLLHS